MGNHNIHPNFPSIYKLKGNHGVPGACAECGSLKGVVLPLQDVLDDIVNAVYGIVLPDSEDCLTINVIKPAAATTTSKLPVVVLIFASGFEFNSPATSDGSTIEHSLALGEPVIYVSMNYRVSAFGFLASVEIKAAGVGNLGLQDQCEALCWIQKYITAFRGDTTHYVWGKSAGAISVSLQKFATGGNTEGLFWAAFMQSSASVPIGSINNGQKYYDTIVEQTGCSGAADTLACLRTVPYPTLKAAQNTLPGLFSYQLIISPTSTDAEFMQWIQTYWLPELAAAQAVTLNSLYPSDVVDGSPFNTGFLNELTLQYKQIAAFQFHTSDIHNIYDDGELMDYLINFAMNLNPNGRAVPNWPTYTTETPNMMMFLDSFFIPTTIINDTYRAAAMQFLANITLEFPM
ncbi:carotenoid ester lipase precursor [Mycena maculata]|uniref:Carotenoid ester lipase n=1 Tax=Mycena maculata TaxID=230809 RepID=A0AAD7ND56_9AGAR|nr:carotenoid ester lipase precursor [Mycena maculata]